MYDFQHELATAYLQGYNGILNAPTGSGKTYAMWLPVIAKHLSDGTHTQKGLRVLWITPLRALAKDIRNALQEACDMFDMDWRVEIRTGDISAKEKQAQKKQLPEALIITPESLHVLLCQVGYEQLFSGLDCVVVDEWHELIGSKRGVQVELAVSRLKAIAQQQQHILRIWGISATIGNLVEAMEVLLGADAGEENSIIVRSEQRKQIDIHTVLPDHIEVLPWAGHIGLKLLPDILKIIRKSTTTLIFTNTRAMAEIWYHALLDQDPALAGIMAMHHGSLSAEVRDWVEENLHSGALKAVICTSSLDLGVDFRPVDTVIQIGSPKGVARFTQRAGRSGHAPGERSTIYFIPTHALELMVIAAIRVAFESGVVVNRYPQVMCFDVLLQYMVTLSISGGFRAADLYREVRNTHAYHMMTPEEWQWLLHHITQGGDTFQAYDEFYKVGKVGDLYRIMHKRAATRHRLSIGTIVSDTVVTVRFMGGGRLGSIEEYFIASLKPGDVFWFAGHCLEFVLLKEMTAYVRKTKEQKAITASYMGGRMPLSGYMADIMRKQLGQAAEHQMDSLEYRVLTPLLDLQRERSALPAYDTMLVETAESKDGFHIFCYPFEGRIIHEVLAGLTAFRISKKQSVSISVAMNDYGFELLCNKPIDITESWLREMLDMRHIDEDVFNSVNATELARRKFRDIAVISGMIFQGYPGEQKRARHLQSGAQLIFDVLRQYEPANLLIKQAYDEILTDQMENARLRTALMRIAKSKILIKHTERFSPLAFPIVVDDLSRNKLSSESLADRIEQMKREKG